MNTAPLKNYLLKFLLSVILTGLSGNAYSQETKTSNGIGGWNSIAWSPTGVPQPADDVVIENDSVVIPFGTTVTINNLEIGNGGNLIVNGNLIVEGSASMTNNSVGYKMGGSSTVVIFGNFTINNQVDLSLSSYLVVYGDFINKGSSNQGELNIDDSSIYVFGAVSGNGFPDSFSCGAETDYSGTTPTVNEDCDYGNESDYEDNQDQIPPEIIDLINCYDLSSIQDKEICPGQSTTFSVPSYPGVNYQWQVNTPNETTSWENTGNNSNTLEITNARLVQNKNRYRVVVTPTSTDVNCKISISRIVTLNVATQNIWTGETNSDWNNNSNWACGYLPDLSTDVLIPESATNYPVLSSGIAGMVKNITIESNAFLTVDSNSLQISGLINNQGTFDATSGTIEMLGAFAQDIPANSFSGNQLENLIIDNPAGTTLLGATMVTGTVHVINGNLISNSYLTLVSSATQTALIDGSGNGEVIGTVNMQRYLDNGFGYKYLSSPFSNTIVSDFSGYVDLNSPFPHVYAYDEDRENNSSDATGWVSYTNGTNPFNVLEGYALNFGSSTDPIAIELSGNLNNGSFSRSLQNNAGIYTKGFNLIGNPYPSPIDWDASGWTKQNIDDALYFFEASADDQYTGTYTSYVNGISNTGDPSASIIPSMQGFFVKVTDGFTTGTLGVSNEVRTTDLSKEFYKQTVPETAKNSMALIRLKAGFDDSSKKDAMVIYFSEFLKDSFEKDKDALKIMNTNSQVPNIYSLDPNGTELSVNGQNGGANSENIRIPLGINTEINGRLKIELTNVQNITANHIYFIDKSKRTAKDLKNENEIFIPLKKGKHDARFELLLTNKNIQDPSLIFNDPLSVSSLKGKVLVQLNLDPSRKGILRAVNLNGQTITTQEVQGSQEIEIKGIKSSGLYFMVLTTRDEKYTKKVLVNL